jgi:WD40 repeat protein
MQEVVFAVNFASLISAQTAAQASPILTIEPGGHTAMVNELIFTRDGRSLISAGDDKVVRIWDVETGELRRTLRGQIGDGHEGRIFAAALSPGGETLAAGGYDTTSQYGSIRFFDLNTGAVAKVLRGHKDVIHGLAFSPDGKWLASGSRDNTVRLWNVRSGKIVHTLRGHTDRVYGVAFSADSERVVSASFDKTLGLWKVSDGKLIREMTGHTAEVHCVAYSPDGKYIASGSCDYTIRLWDGRTGEFAKTLGTHDDYVATMCFSPDSGRLVSVGGSVRNLDTKARVWRVPSGELLTTFDKHNNSVVASAFSPDGETIATAGSETDIYLWDAETGVVKAHIVGTGSGIWSIAFSPDGREFAFGNTVKSGWKPNDYGDPERRFDLLDMTLLEDISSGEGRWRRVVMEHAGSTLKQEDELNLSIQRSGRTQATITMDDYVEGWTRCYTFTPSGEIVVGSDFALALYDSSGEWEREFIGHTGEVWAAAVSPDGRYLISGSSDQTVRLWNVRTGELLTSFFIGSDREWVAWTPAGYYKASPGGDRLIGWHVNQGEESAAEYYYAYQYRRKFYRSDVLERILEEGSVEEAVAAADADRPGVSQVISIDQILRMKPPKVRILSPDDNAATEESEIEVQLAITGEEREAEVTIAVNGRPAWKDERFIVDPIDVIHQTVALEPGRNTISAIARNENAVSQPATVVVSYQKPQAIKPDLYMLAIGVSDHADTRYDLDYADEDAQAMADIFEGQKGKLFGSVDAKVLLNDDATRDNILDGLDWLLEEATQRDVGIIFIAGHGMHDPQGDYYFFPHDGDDGHLRRSAVNWHEFKGTLTDLSSKALLFVDTCHAASAAGRGRGSRDLDITDIIADLAADEVGVVVMAVSTGRETSIERKDWRHGAFTLALTEGLSGKADYNKDGAVYLTDIDAYVTDRVKELTDGKQHPTTQKPTTVRSFPLVLVP